MGALAWRLRNGSLLMATLRPYTMETHYRSGRPPFLRRQARVPTCHRCLSLRMAVYSCKACALLHSLSLQAPPG